MLQLSESEVVEYYDSIRSKPGVTPRGEFGEYSSESVGKSYTASAATLNKKLTVMRWAFKQLFEAGLIAKNPFHFVAIPNPKADRRRPPNVIPFEKCRAMLDLFKSEHPEDLQDHALLSCMLGGGLRAGELVKLRISDFQKSETGTVFLLLRNTKAGRDEEQALAHWAALSVARWVAKRFEAGANQEDSLFCGRLRKGNHQPGIHVRTIGRKVKLWCKRVDLDPKFFSPHSNRHTAITKLVSDQDHHIVKIQKFARHRSIQTTMEYCHAFEDLHESAGIKLAF